MLFIVCFGIILHSKNIKKYNIAIIVEYKTKEARGPLV